jgi:hypothetical protein
MNIIGIESWTTLPKKTKNNRILKINSCITSITKQVIKEEGSALFWEQPLLSKKNVEI